MARVHPLRDRRHDRDEDHDHRRVVHEAADDCADQQRRRDDDARARTDMRQKETDRHVQGAGLDDALADDQQRENRDQRRIGESSQQRIRAEQVLAVGAGHGEEMEEDEEKPDKRDRGDFERKFLGHIAGDRRHNGDEGDRHLQCQAIKNQAIASRPVPPPTFLHARPHLPITQREMSIAPRLRGYDESQISGLPRGQAGSRPSPYCR